MVVLLLALLAMPSAAPQSQSASAAERTIPEKGTAAISGRVISEATGRPLRRAQIRVTAPGMREPRTTSTDASGEYEVRDLPPGRYTINVTRSGHLPLQYGQRRYGEAGSPLQVDEGQALKKIDFARQRAGIIGGRILDDTGEPIAGVIMFAMQTQFFQGRRQLVPVGGYGRTDDTGRYRILSVPPGAYTIMATTRETWVSDTDAKQLLAFVPTYFPGTVSAADALRVKVKAAEEVQSIDFSMVAGRTATLSGIAVSSDGLPLAGATVRTGQEIIGPGGGIVGVGGSTAVAGDGTWRLSGLQPGEYRLSVSSTAREGRAESASMIVVVQGNDIENITLRTDAGGVLSGQIVADGDGPLPASPVPVSVLAQSLLAGRRSVPTTPGEDDGRVRADGTFTRRSPSGPVSIRVMPLPDGWAVKSVELDGADRTALPIEVAGGERIEKIKIVISNRFSAITGRMTDAKGNPVDGTALLFATEPSKWGDWTVNARTARPDQSGLFRFDTVRPGEYFVIALEALQQWQVNDPEFLETLQDAATRITIDEREVKTVNLRVKQ